jgi:hypothetical protein
MKRASTSSPSPSSTRKHVRLALPQNALERLNKDTADDTKGFKFRMDAAGSDNQTWHSLSISILVILADALRGSELEPHVIPLPQEKKERNNFLLGFNAAERDDWRVRVQKSLTDGNWAPVLEHRTLLVSHDRSALHQRNSDIKEASQFLGPVIVTAFYKPKTRSRIRPPL